MPMFNENDFWEFSKLHYGYDGSKDSFIWLQDNLNLNVNLLLFSMYLVDGGYLITAEQFLSLDACLAESESKTEILRKKRRKIGGAEYGSTEYKEALLLELAAERVQQSVLFKNVKILSGMSKLKSKAPNDVIEEHLKMLIETLSNLKNTIEFINNRQALNYHLHRVINNYLTNV